MTKSALTEGPRSGRYGFADFELNLLELRLTRSGRVVPLEPKVFQVLVALLERPGEPVSKEALLDRVWGDVVVGDNVVSRAVAKLRKVLGEEAAALVETVHTIGYRFIGEVRRQTECAVAVLPFANLAGEPGEDYFADGITDSLIASLSGIGALRVISRRSVMRYRDSTLALSQIGTELEVQAVVEGSVLRTGSQVRITTQLINLDPEAQLWGDTFDGAMGDVLTLLDEVAGTVARQVRAALAPEESQRLARRRPVDPEAFDHCLKGRYYWYGMASPDLERALAHFEQAAAIDPENAIAHTGVADIWGSSGVWGVVPRAQALNSALPALEKALAIDDTLAETLEVAARLATYYEHDWELADRRHADAVALRPSYAEGQLFYAIYLAVVGRREEAQGRLEHALRLDPHNPLVRAAQCWFLMAAGRPEEAVDLVRTRPGTDATQVALPPLWAAYEELGMYREATAAARRFCDGLGHRGLVQPLQLSDEAASDYRRIMGEAAEGLVAAQSERFVQPVQVARLFAAAGREDDALDWLEKAWEKDDPFLALLPLDAGFRSLRDQARLKDVLQQLKLG